MWNSGIWTWTIGTWINKDHGEYSSGDMFGIPNGPNVSECKYRWYSWILPKIYLGFLWFRIPPGNGYLLGRSWYKGDNVQKWNIEPILGDPNLLLVVKSGWIAQWSPKIARLWWFLFPFLFQKKNFKLPSGAGNCHCPGWLKWNFDSEHLAWNLLRECLSDVR